MEKSNRRSGCPLSISLERLGDRWSLLIVRDLMVRGFRTFKEFQESGEVIATNILTNRLRRLEASGIITGEAGETDARRVNYRLTEKGIDLAPVLLDLLIWAARHEEPNEAHPDWRGGLSAAGLDLPAIAAFGALMGTIAAAPRRLLDVRCRHNHHLGADEARMLQLIGLLQRDGHESAAAILADWIPAAAVRIGMVAAHDFAAALDALDRSIELSPSWALTYSFSSILRAWKGDDPGSVAHAETALRHSPYDPLIWMPYIGLAYTHFFSGRFEEAISAADRALQGNPRFSVPAFLRTAALARLGREAEAAASARRLLELQPGFTIASLVDSEFTKSKHLAMLADALRQAGLPE